MVAEPMCQSRLKGLDVCTYTGMFMLISSVLRDFDPLNDRRILLAIDESIE